MTKIWGQVFWKGDPSENEEGAVQKPYQHSQWALLKSKYLMVLPVIFLPTLTVFLSLNPDFLVSISFDTADQLLNPEPYINTVLGKETSP
jgi:multicomponent Na+:H+ antiporter subunit D